MKRLKYPLLVLIVFSIILSEGIGQYLRLSKMVTLADKKIYPGTVYSCLYLKDLRKGGSKKDVPAANTHIHPDADAQNPQNDTEHKNTNEKDIETAEPLPFTTVDASYFDDALFIGDSRMVGLHDYAGLERATYYAEVGLTIYSLFDDEIATLADGSMGTLEQALTQKQFGKIYLMVGINELGTGTREKFFDTYRQAVERIRQLQPNALIFVQGILYVTEERSKSDAYINNPNIMQRNSDIATLANQKNIFYIDVNEIYSDGRGNLSTEYTFDNAHLKGACYGQWRTFLMEHGVVPEQKQ